MTAPLRVQRREWFEAVQFMEAHALGEALLPSGVKFARMSKSGDGKIISHTHYLGEPNRFSPSEQRPRVEVGDWILTDSNGGQCVVTDVEFQQLYVERPVPGPTEPERGTPPAPVRLWDENVLEAMAVWGGGFVKALRQAYLVADHDNRRRILEVWDPLYGHQYRQQAKHLRDADETLDLPAAKTGNCVGSIGE